MELQQTKSLVSTSEQGGRRSLSSKNCVTEHKHRAGARRSRPTTWPGARYVLASEFASPNLSIQLRLTNHRMQERSATAAPLLRAPPLLGLTSSIDLCRLRPPSVTNPSPRTRHGSYQSSNQSSNRPSLLPARAGQKSAPELSTMDHDDPEATSN